MEQADDLERLWQRYTELENRADRASILDALGAFVERLETAPESLRQAWVEKCIRASSDPSGGFPMRAPLFQRVVFPALKSRYLAGDAAAARSLAELSQQLFRYRLGWEALGYPHEVDLWKEAHRRDPSSELARERLVASVADFLQHTLHELPAGVLYGTDGASVRQCDDLLDELAFFRGLLTPSEAEQFRQLLGLASFHYPTYRAYLLQDSKQGYAAFLAERGDAPAG